MMTTDMQTRLSKSCSDAAVGYATAATEAYAEMTTKKLWEFWAEQIRSLVPEEEEEPRSWYRHPDGPQRKPRKTAPQAAMPLMPNPWSPASNLANMMTSSPPAALFSSWLSLVSTPRAPVTWPMAMMFMSAGVPHAVAVPAAEANAADARRRQHHRGGIPVRFLQLPHQWRPRVDPDRREEAREPAGFAGLPVGRAGIVACRYLALALVAGLVQRLIVCCPFDNKKAALP